MNAAAKALNQHQLFDGQWSDIRLSTPRCVQIILLFAVLSTALAVVYVTNVYRLTQVQLEQVEQESRELEMQWGQLLLEQASLETPARVEALASEKLQMELPTDKLILRVQ